MYHLAWPCLIQPSACSLMLCAFSIHYTASPRIARINDAVVLASRVIYLEDSGVYIVHHSVCSDACSITDAARTLSATVSRTSHRRGHALPANITLKIIKINGFSAVSILKIF